MSFLDRNGRNRPVARHWVPLLGFGAFFALGPASCVGRTVDDGTGGNETGGSGPSTGASSSTGGTSGDGGKPSTGGTSGGDGGAGTGGLIVSDGGGPSGGAAGEPGTGGLGGQGAICNLPFDGGHCDAAIPVYYHNEDTGLCEPTVYGGCGGNENRFETLSACEEFCGVLRAGVYCEVNGRTYPHGASGVPDPLSCNTCSCKDGELTGCTEISCPTPCPGDSLPATECADCGPTDACLTVRHTCLPACGPADECLEGGWCNNGVCRKNFCG